MAITTDVCEFGRPAPPFALPSTSGETISLPTAKGARGTLVVFICNHCPYVVAILPKLIRDATALAKLGVATIAITSNDADMYPEDSFANMKRVVADQEFPFPYLYDESQDVARDYGAQCTPDFFGFNAELKLQYRGRLDESRMQSAPDSARREMFEAMKGIAATGKGPKDQSLSMGCAIKWKPE